VRVTEVPPPSAVVQVPGQLNSASVTGDRPAGGAVQVTVRSNTATIGPLWSLVGVPVAASPRLSMASKWYV